MHHTVRRKQDTNMKIIQSDNENQQDAPNDKTAATDAAVTIDIGDEPSQPSTSSSSTSSSPSVLQRLGDHLDHYCHLYTYSAHSFNAIIMCYLGHYWLSLWYIAFICVQWWSEKYVATTTINRLYVWRWNKNTYN